MARSPYTHMHTTIETLPPLEGLKELVKALRDKEYGCPWDIQQDLQDLAPLTLEEAYEVAQALEDNNTDALKEELGDLLFHIVFYARIAEEKELFDFDAIALEAKEKMLRRHPHVFAGKDIDGLSVGDVWEAQKMQEKQQNPKAEVPTVFPALLLAARLGKLAAREGFDWHSPKDALLKVKEEFSELEEVLENHDQKTEEEWGDLVFACAQVARKLGFSPEYALRKACTKFSRRYQEMKAHKDYQPSLSLEEKETLWEEAKKRPLSPPFPLEFVKMNGLGNDFVIVDFRYKEHQLTQEQISILSDRRFGIGCDQFVMIVTPTHHTADAEMIFYNCDGRPAEACGNATRCVAMLIMEEKGASACVLQTGNVCISVHKDKDNLFTASMGVPSFVHPTLPDDPTPLLSFVPEALEVKTVNVGNPHVAFLVPPHVIETLPLDVFGPKIEHHPLFPQQCNVEIVSFLGEQKIRVRVWERGAGITLACGTGACASVAVFVNEKHTTMTEVVMDGGSLFITRNPDETLFMKGPATLNFRGKTLLP
jgi:diaminopimelate epimerase